MRFYQSPSVCQPKSDALQGNWESGNALDAFPGHVEFDDSSLPAANDPRTLSAWVNLDSVPKACGSAGETQLLGIMVCKGETAYVVGWLADMESDGTMERGVWNHITTAYDGEFF